MPVKVKKVDGYQVSHGGKVSAKGTSYQKAQAQASLLRGIEHGWEPTGGKAARKYIKKGRGGRSRAAGDAPMNLGLFIEKREKL